jgi:hypothetical protein
MLPLITTRTAADLECAHQTTSPDLLRATTLHPDRPVPFE